jgi:hypothetical protein
MWRSRAHVFGQAVRTGLRIVLERGSRLTLARR